jgi:hypothetical protein
MVLVILASAALASEAPAATPAAPKPPTVHTGYASPSSPSSATVRAKVDPHGLATEYRFDYGTTTAYGALTPSAPAGSGTQEAAVAQTIGGLAPFTTYHYRVIATSSAGTAIGQDATFTTRKAPLALTITSTPDPVVFGGPLTVSGALSGTGAAGVQVVLQANPFPYTHGFHNPTSPLPAGADGDFSFPVAGMFQGAQLRVSTIAKPVIHSATITELVALHVTLHVRPARRRGFVRLYGTVTPAQPGASVAFERRDGAHRYIPVSGTAVRSGKGEISRFARTVRLRHRGVYRALVEIPSGAQVSGRSRPIVIR